MIYGNDVLTEDLYQKWFAKFSSGDFEVNNAPCSNLRAEIDSRLSLMKIYFNRCEKLIQYSVYPMQLSDNHLLPAGFRHYIWGSLELKETKLATRISICDSLRKRQNNDVYLKWTVTGHEGKIVYNDIVRKRSWKQSSKSSQITSTSELHLKKIMLSVYSGT